MWSWHGGQRVRYSLFPLRSACSEAGSKRDIDCAPPPACASQLWREPATEIYIDLAPQILDCGARKHRM